MNLNQKYTSSVILAISCFIDISSDKVLEEDNTNIAFSSSNIFPYSDIIYINHSHLLFYMNNIHFKIKIKK